MRIMKRLVTLLLAVCLIVPGFTITADASEGIIFFSDLETKVGDTFTIAGTVKNRTGDLGEITIQMSYDASAMRFISGENVTEGSAGSLTYEGSVSNTDRVDFEMEFQALAEGTTRLEQVSETVTSSEGNTLDLEEGYAEITIGEGDPSKIPASTNHPSTAGTIVVEDVEYTLASEFDNSEIPNGFEAVEVTYEDTIVTGAKQKNGDLTLLYLLDGNQEGKFFVYDEAKNSFSPFELISISESTSIILLQKDKNLEQPSAQYEEVSLTLNESKFPAWQDSKNRRYYLVYASTADGEKGFYRYDQEENTYQYFGTSTQKAPESVEKEGKFGTVSSYMEEHVDYFLIGAAFILIVLILFIIILAVKLHNRNVELDKVYLKDDEPNELEVEESSTSRKRKNTPKASKEMKQGDTFQDTTEIMNPKSFTDDYDNFEDDYDEFDMENEWEDDYSYYMSEDDWDQEESRDNIFDDFEESDQNDFLDDFAEEKPKGKAKKKKRNKEDDFGLDFIDLD